VLHVHFLDLDAFQFSGEDQALITETARGADGKARGSLPLVEHLNLLVEPSDAVLDSSGDNAYTMSPHLIRWRVDPARGVAEVTRGHLAKAFLHEAFHAARFRRLPQEANASTWTCIAIGEGLATAFARDAGDAREPWAIYDPAVIDSWTTELLNQPMGPAGLGRWKVRHEDGREWIAFRVGVRLVDSVTERTGQIAADLVWTPADQIAALAGIRPPG
jgi:Predicted Zn-dependent protease (DUF2268)